MKINEYISLLKKEEKEFDENLKRESIKRSMIKDDFEKKFEEFRIKTTKSFSDIAANSYGDFTFSEVENESYEYYNEEEKMEAEFRNRRDYNYEYDNKKELIFNFNIKTAKYSQSYTSIIHFFNSDENFSVHIELKKDSKNNETVEKKVNFVNYISENFEENLVSLLTELNMK